MAKIQNTIAQYTRPECINTEHDIFTLIRSTEDIVNHKKIQPCCSKTIHEHDRKRSHASSTVVSRVVCGVTGFSMPTCFVYKQIWCHIVSALHRIGPCMHACYQHQRHVTEQDHTRDIISSSKHKSSTTNKGLGNVSSS